MVSRPGSSPPVTWTTKTDRALGQALRDLDSVGVRPVCVGSPDGGPWLSEDKRMRTTAIRRCIACPVIAECDRAAKVGRITWGVWAGVDRGAAAEQKARAKAARARKTKTKTKTKPTARRTAC